MFNILVILVRLPGSRKHARQASDYPTIEWTIFEYNSKTFTFIFKINKNFQKKDIFFAWLKAVFRVLWKSYAKRVSNYYIYKT